MINEILKFSHERSSPMFSRFKMKNRIVSIELNDLYIRALSFTEGDLSSASVFDYPLPAGVVEEEVVKDEMQFYEIIKDLVKEWGISKHDLRFFVPDHAVLMRTFEHPQELTPLQIKEYVEMELDETIHLPFKNPLIDIYDHDVDDGKAVLFAAPSEDVYVLMRLYEDVNLEPSVLDVRALCNLRYLKRTNFLSPNKTYLIADWSVDSVSICIYTNGNVDFLRFQPIETPTKNWRYITTEADKNVYFYEGEIGDYRIPLTDQALEVERILNFYRFSLHKGEKQVDEIIMVGDNPEMNFIADQIRSTVEIPIEVIDDEFVKRDYPDFEAKDIALIGLSLKGENQNGS